MSNRTAPRLYVPAPLAAGLTLTLPPGPSRHAQVLRLQPGDAVTLFNGDGGEWAARIVRMGRSDVDAQVLQHDPADRELPVAVTLAVGMPANDRMDWLVEKATELGVATIQPLVCERSVLRLAGERAGKKVAHWSGVAISASEQCGRTRVPVIAPVQPLRAWCEALPAAADDELRAVLSLQDAQPLAALPVGARAVFLSGPEGGLAPAEEALARTAGFRAASLGPRVLRAETAPLAALALLGLR
ncbi:16S rRNA (uracil(1498)-N(3))-methyltransferase [Caldimonas thermodepolymerans]|jgi:RNA methyltransferase, RsmE family|uniref:Ribosomal RNA small subunit methyltransferase E n=1 Tax=Caldimonas thermodepolymerans TaxID=215580 RepID=A0A2S5T3W2_9BURK|nr:16S rRNA (uracil(1498)-N(3))-methyltransferase [Caldimonas thermodepolymerans]PPE69674.1 16S rRNA (uracil(1498)-N(3))-methyltransferase [Caldimonas thermodepolymerans]QPC31916.1 16S rRNA (uracil(1498)-N(3))-methyltransferase [Caldimonas thermodepolymerans]RDI01565.1 16S rRNA (uracil1498-N3)-methyltransferase [Caldimonas thermodepolymerans]TCP04987.1 16S rRNA (uracil1498-N3)-methyltransferase [Caldimonas thermodepolymerans]UZG44704.1 16S rRNA (uracil(1498)-N(3))-methyltransferase [Caldimonas